VEIKPTSDIAIAAQVVHLARAMGLLPQLLISSFDMNLLQACRRAEPAARIAYLYSAGTPLWEEIGEAPAAIAKQYGLYAFHPLVLLVTEEFIAECHAAGVAVNPWTVNLPHALETLRGWGADGIITDEPGRALEVLHGEF